MVYYQQEWHQDIPILLSYGEKMYTLKSFVHLAGLWILKVADWLVH